MIFSSMLCIMLILCLPFGLTSLVILGVGCVLGLADLLPFIIFYSPWEGLDQLAYVMVILVVLVGFLSMSSSSSSMHSMGFSSCVVGSALVSLLFFLSSSLFLFFVFFEGGLLPLVGLILGWGYQPERLQACLCLVLYTVVGSLPLLICICWAFSWVGSDSMVLIKGLLSTSHTYFWVALLLGFIIKMPVFGVHGWLPKAHVEAPVAGSMILAGVLLKFGCYGMMRVMWCFNWSACLLGSLIISVSIWGGVVSALICLVQSDMKSLIAYSSISHMSMVVVGIMSCSSFGWVGSLLMMFGHGISSPVLFGMANYVYSLFHSRSVMVCKGLLAVCPLMCFCLFAGSTVSMGVPPSLNFFSEVALICSGFFYSPILWLPLGLISFFGAAYSLYLYSCISHGGVSSLSLSSVPRHPGMYLSVLSCYILVVMSLSMDFFYM